MVTSDEGLEKLAGYEGKRNKAYQDVVGIWTNGVGHTGPDVHEGQVVDDAQVLTWLREDVKEAEDAVNRLVTVALTQDQFDSLVSFVFNLGAGALEHSTLLKKLNAGDYQEAGQEFEKWDHAGGHIQPGLLKRRHAEAAAFV